MGITGQAMRLEKKNLEAIDRGEPKKKSVRKSLAEPNTFMLAESDSTKLENVRERLTREYVPGNYYQPALLQQGPIFQEFKGPRTKHDWPAFREANLNALVDGKNADEARILNFHAIWLLQELRRLTEAAEPQSDFLKHNQTGYVDGFKSDDVSDMGPTPAKIMSLWCGSEPGEPTRTGRNRKLVPRLTSQEIKQIWKQRTEPVVNKKWPAGHRTYQEVTVNSGHAAFASVDDGGGVEINVEALLSVGDLMFNNKGELIKFVKSYQPNGEKNWVDFLDRNKQSKGSKKSRISEKMIPTIAESGLPQNKNEDVVMPVDAFIRRQDIASLTGDTLLIVPDEVSMESVLDPDSDEGFGKKSHSSFDAFLVAQAKEYEQDFAEATLEQYKRMMGRLPFEAMVNAAMGLRLCEIGGGPRGDKRAIAKAKTRITDAVTALFDAAYDSAAPTQLAA